MLLDRYELLEEIGRGTSGVVYRARERSSGRIVAIKLFREPVGADKSGGAGSQPLLLEAGLLGRLDHPGVVKIIEVAADRETPFLVTEFVQGTSLDELIAKRGALPVDQALTITRQVAEALAAAHRQGIMHRDVKPANLLVAYDGAVKLTDFGVAKDGERESEPSRAAGRYLWGTPAYLSPERLQGEEGDGRSDLYALGVVLYLMVTGRLPFESKSMSGLQHAIRNTEPILPSRLRPGLPDSIDSLLMRALSKEPQLRFQDGFEFAAAAEETLETLDLGRIQAAPIKTARRDDPMQATRRVKRAVPSTWRRLALSAAVIAAVLLLATLPNRSAAVAAASNEAPPVAAAPLTSHDLPHDLPHGIPHGIPHDVPTEPPIATVAVAPQQRLDLKPTPSSAAQSAPAPVPAQPLPTAIASEAARPRTLLPEATEQVEVRGAAEISAPVSAGRKQSRAKPVPVRSTRGRPRPATATAQIKTIVSAPPVPTTVTAPAETEPSGMDTGAAGAGSTAPISTAGAIPPEAAAPAPNSAEPGRGVIELEHGLQEGLVEILVGGRRVGLIRIVGGSPSPVVASFDTPPGSHSVRIAVLSASERLEANTAWTETWEPGQFSAHKLVLSHQGPGWLIAER